MLLNLSIIFRNYHLKKEQSIQYATPCVDRSPDGLETHPTLLHSANELSTNQITLLIPHSASGFFFPRPTLILKK